MKVCLFIILAFLAGCIQSPGEPKLESMGLIKPVEYSISGTIFGLSGGSAIITNGSEELTLSSNGAFNFAKKVSPNTAYSISVTPPAGQNCLVSGGNGTVTKDVTQIEIRCSSSNRFFVSGSIGGLTSDGLQLRLKTGAVTVDEIPVGKDATNFIFNVSLSNSSNYTVEIVQNPSGLNCFLSGALGTISSANITNVSTTCVASGNLNVRGRVYGLSNGESIVLASNSTSGSNPLTIQASAGQPEPDFELEIPSSHRAVLKIKDGPLTKFCKFSGTNLGQFASSPLLADVENVNITCALRDHTKCQVSNKEIDLPNTNYTLYTCNDSFLTVINSTAMNHGQYIGYATQANISGASATFPQAQDIVSGGVISAVVSDGSGGWYIGGSFTRVGNKSRQNLAHLFSDMTLDESFDVQPSGNVKSIIKSGQMLFVAGEFNNIKMSSGADNVERKGIAKINISGATPTLEAFNLNSIFTATNWSSGNGGIYSMTLDTDTLYYIGRNLITADANNYIGKINHATNGSHSQAVTTYVSPSASLVANAGSILIYSRNSGSTAYLRMLSASDFSIQWSTTLDRVGKARVIGSEVFALTTSSQIYRYNLSTGTAITPANFKGTTITNAKDFEVDSDKICFAGENLSIASNARGGLACLRLSDGVDQNISAPLTYSFTSIALGPSSLFLGPNSQTLGNRSYTGKLLRLNLQTMEWDYTGATATPTITSPSYLETHGSHIYVLGNFTSYNSNSAYKYFLRFNKSTLALDTSYVMDGTVLNVSHIPTFLGPSIFYRYNDSGNKGFVNSLTGGITNPSPLTLSSTYITGTSDIIRIGSTYYDHNLSTITTPPCSLGTFDRLIAIGTNLWHTSGTSKQVVDKDCAVLGTLPKYLNYSFKNYDSNYTCGEEGATDLIYCYDTSLSETQPLKSNISPGVFQKGLVFMGATINDYYFPLFIHNLP